MKKNVWRSITQRTTDTSILTTGIHDSKHALCDEGGKFKHMAEINPWGKRKKTNKIILHEHLHRRALIKRFSSVELN